MSVVESMSLEEVLRSQPHAIVERDGVRFTLLGTAHVSQASVEAVRDAIASGRFDAVAVELDGPRLQALTDPDALARLDLIQVIRTGKTAMFAANLALAAYQRRLAEQLGVEPGAELKRAVLEARQRDLPVHLIDRDVGLTFKRASARLGFWGRAKLGGGLLTALFANEEVSPEEIEKLKQGDMLESSFGEFATDSPVLYETVIAERATATWPRACVKATAACARCWRWSAPATCKALRNTCARKRAQRHKCATNWKRSRRKAASRISPSRSPRSCSAVSPGVSGRAASMSAPICCCSGC